MALDTNLISYYKLDESSGNAADSKGSNTLVNTGSSAYAAALINNGVDFGTANSTKMLSIASDLSIAVADPVTFSMWVKDKTNPSSGVGYYYMNLYTVEAGPSEVIYQIVNRNNGGTPRIEFGRMTPGFAGDKEIFYNHTVGTSAFTHLVLVYNGSVMEGYINGVSVGTIAATTTGNYPGLTDQFQLGTRGDGNTVNGSICASSIIDEVGIWDRALTSAEVTQLYNGGAGISYPFPNAYTSTLTETAVITGSMLRSVVRTLSETVTNTPTFVSVKAAVKILTETVTNLDTVLKQASRTLSEVVTGTATLLKNPFRVLSETMTATDTFASLKIIPAVLSETTSYVDTLIRNISRTLTETITNTDTLVYIRGLLRTFTETLVATDTLLTARVILRTLTETLSFLDQLIVKFNGIVTNLWAKVSRGDDEDSDWNKTPQD